MNVKREMQAALLAPTRTQARLLPLLKVLYFLNGWSGASFGRFATLYYLDRGLNSRQIGHIEAVQPLAAAVGNQLGGWITDRLQRKKLVALVCRVITTALLELFLLPWIGCSGCEMQILLVMASIAFFSIGGGLLDSYTLDALGKARRHEYGRYRLWTAVSWGLGNAVMGILAQINFEFNFICFGVLNTAAILLMGVALPARTSSETERVAERTRARASSRDTGSAERSRAVASSSTPEAGFCASLCRWRVLAYLALMAYFGIASTVVEKFLFVYLSHSLGASASLCGYSVGITVIFELPIFHYASALLRRVGHDAMVLVALLAHALRCYAYTLLTPSSVWWLLAIEPLHGVTFALMWVPAVDKIKLDWPPEWQSSGQLTMNTAQNCVGRVAGSVFAGYWIQHGHFAGERGGRSLYLVAAIASAAVFVLHASTSALLVLCGRPPLLAPAPSRAMIAASGTPPLRAVSGVAGESPTADERDGTVEPLDAGSINGSPMRTTTTSSVRPTSADE